MYIIVHLYKKTFFISKNLIDIILTISDCYKNNYLYRDQ